ncbi:MAG: UbiA family prenyltransferase [Bacteroidales bacterium]|nr:UbiA family prenyltransferase [Bacteroidales bacterium]
MGWIRNYTRLVKFEHTLFALPFALIGFFMAYVQPGSVISLRLLLLVVLCMVFARNAAMGFNRWIDRRYDRLNPRTSAREIPAGVISPRAALLFVIVNSLLFVAATWFINPLCFYLSPVALFVVLFYSYTKRITSFSHFVLSLGLAIAPLGAYLAVTSRFDWPPMILSTIVFFWVSGFDIIYSLQDEEFDKEQKLRSLPARLGKKRALRFSEAIHLVTALLVVLLGVVLKGGGLHWAGVLWFCGLLLSQHLLVKPHDLSRVNLAFFTTNGLASVAYAVFLIADMLLR